MKEKGIVSAISKYGGATYIAVDVQPDIFLMIESFVRDLGIDWHLDEVDQTRSPKNYKLWKDMHFHCEGKSLKIDVICGDKKIHLVVQKNLQKGDEFFSVLSKYFEMKKCN